MLRFALIFLLIAVVAGVFGFFLGKDLWASALLLSTVFLILFFVTLGTPTE